MSDKISYRSFFEYEHDGRRKERLISRLERIISEELTDRQRQLVELYYFEGENIPTIAKRLGINRSTVSRGLKRARICIGRFMGYDIER